MGPPENECKMRGTPQIRVSGFPRTPSKEVILSLQDGLIKSAVLQHVDKMALMTYSLLAALCSLIIFAILNLGLSARRSSLLPPGPRTLPFIGEVLKSLSKKKKEY